ncbi:MAG TPA: 2Fe-2S iron-sulfur cluster-binding protein [Planctomycetota bacterium]|nr:2Fe-2S iron-sulfur cluster-binding protein [Planctomycetota bacterium]
MPRLTINGKKVRVKKSETVLHAARKLDIHIPTFCYHEALEPYGACRLCLVEVVGGGRPGLATACTQPAVEGLEILTDTERVTERRRMIAELLLARNPDSPRLKELAAGLGVTETRFEPHPDRDDCLLCGLCTRVCSQLIGQAAISFVHRGAERKVMPPFDETSEICMACGACIAVCPTGKLKFRDEDGCRIIEEWKTKQPLARCTDCGTEFATRLMMEVLKEKLDLPAEYLDLCPSCRTKTLSETLLATKTFAGASPFKHEE